MGVDTMIKTAELAVSTAELLVRVAEADLAAATDPTFKDIAETELREYLQLQDEVLAKAAPMIEREQQDEEEKLAKIVWQAMLSSGDRGYDYMSTQRRHMSTAVKARIVRKFGRRKYEALPW